MLFVKSHVACCVCWYIAQTNNKYLYMLDRNKKVDLRKGELTVNMIKNTLIFRLWIITKHKRGYSYSKFLIFAVQRTQIRAFVVPEQHLPVINPPTTIEVMNQSVLLNLLPGPGYHRLPDICDYCCCIVDPWPKEPTSPQSGALRLRCGRWC